MKRACRSGPVEAGRVGTCPDLEIESVRPPSLEQPLTRGPLAPRCQVAVAFWGELIAPLSDDLFQFGVSHSSSVSPIPVP